MTLRRRLLALALACAAAAARAGAADLRGTWRLRSADVTLTLVVEQPGGDAIRGTLQSSNGTTFALEGTLEGEGASGRCTGAGGTSLFQIELEGPRTLVLTLVEVGPSGVGGARSLVLEREGSAAARAAPAPDAPAAKGPSGRPPAAAVGPAGAPALRAYFAGEYYSFTRGSTLSGGGGTERTLTLCADGRYRDSYESGAHGDGAWGQAVQQGGGGRWAMEGTRERGTLLLTDGGGTVRRVPYEVVSKSEQTIRFGGTTFAFAGAARCR